MTASFTVNAAAPVKLGTLTAKAGGNGKPMLSWETFTEDNADFFSVQRSENGKAFQEIGRVKAAGNSTSSRKYGFIDATVDQRFRYFYYQLLVVDLDKKEERSRIILYRQETQKKNIIVSLSPNPVQAGDHLQLWFNADERTKMQATIYEATGRQVYKDELSAYTGVNFAHLHIHDLLAGVYLLKLSIGKLKETRTFTVQ